MGEKRNIHFHKIISGKRGDMDQRAYSRLNRKQLLSLLIKAMTENEELRKKLDNPLSYLDEERIEALIAAEKERCLRILESIAEMEKLAEDADEKRNRIG